MIITYLTELAAIPCECAYGVLETKTPLTIPKCLPLQLAQVAGTMNAGGD